MSSDKVPIMTSFDSGYMPIPYGDSQDAPFNQITEDSIKAEIPKPILAVRNVCGIYYPSRTFADGLHLSDKIDQHRAAIEKRRQGPESNQPHSFEFIEGEVMRDVLVSCVNLRRLQYLDILETDKECDHDFRAKRVVVETEEKGDKEATSTSPSTSAMNQRVILLVDALSEMKKTRKTTVSQYLILSLVRFMSELLFPLRKLCRAESTGGDGTEEQRAPHVTVGVHVVTLDRTKEDEAYGLLSTAPEEVWEILYGRYIGLTGPRYQVDGEDERVREVTGAFNRLVKIAERIMTLSNSCLAIEASDDVQLTLLCQDRDSYGSEPPPPVAEHWPGGIVIVSGYRYIAMDLTPLDSYTSLSDTFAFVLAADDSWRDEEYLIIKDMLPKIFEPLFIERKNDDEDPSDPLPAL